MKALAIVATFFLLLAVVIVLANGHAVHTTDTAAENAANRSANAAEGLATTVPAAINAAAASNSGNNGYNSGISDSVCKALAGNADGFGENVNPAWVTFLAPNGCMISTNGGVDFKVPAGWRADFTDLDGNFHSCGSSTGDGGLYGPADGSAENAISMWQIGSEKHCLKWTTWGETHPNASSSTTNTGNGGNAASTNSNGTSGQSAQVEPTAQPTIAPSNGGNIGGNDTTSGGIETMSQLLGFKPGMSKSQMLKAWKTYVGKIGTIHTSAEDPSFAMTPDGGIVVELDGPTTLPPYLEAHGGAKGVTILAGDNARTMDNGAFWRIYPPKELRDAMGLTGGSTAA